MLPWTLLDPQVRWEAKGQWNMFISFAHLVGDLIPLFGTQEDLAFTISFLACLEDPVQIWTTCQSAVETVKCPIRTYCVRLERPISIWQYWHHCARGLSWEVRKTSLPHSQGRPEVPGNEKPLGAALSQWPMRIHVQNSQIWDFPGSPVIRLRAPHSGNLCLLPD